MQEENTSDVESNQEVLDDTEKKAQDSEGKSPQQKKPTIKSFFLHLFNWKYLLVAALIGMLAQFFSMAKIFELELILDAASVFTFILSIVQAEKYKGGFWRNLLMLISSFVVLRAVYFLGVFLIIAVTPTKSYVDITMESNVNYPQSIQKHIEMLKWTSEGEKQLSNNYRTKTALKEYFEQDGKTSQDFIYSIRKNYLRDFCNDKKAMEAVDDGLALDIKFYDSANVFMGKLQVTRASCKSLFKNYE